ncbi:purine-nucleoside phosphorylase [Herpetosiphon sp. NSE202]|uniref:purine-nucleoside phosphorylase n=1 Tax=Herpetosiphon sp. NSE202 TaxID=3351349 RepID=UPI0036309AAD
MTTNRTQAIHGAVAAIRRYTDRVPQVGIILGSGLSQLVDHIQNPVVVSYSNIPGFAPSAVPGHRGELVLGELGGVSVLAMRGRFHFYEGYGMDEVTLPVHVMRALGADTLIVTNAAGGLNANWQVGDLMRIADHIFLPGMAGFHPLRGHNDDTLGPRFPAMLNAYDAELGTMAKAAAERAGATLREGVYAMLAGPSFETGAEMNYLRGIGVDAVGMSTAPEAIVARYRGMRVLGISLITNIAHPDAPPANHEEVLEAGETAKPMFSALISDVLSQIAAYGK